jgi:hypothetical protein
MGKFTDTELNKLPKWALQKITDLIRERETAIRALNEHLDNQTVSPFYSDDYEILGEKVGPSSKIKYFQAHKMKVRHAGVDLDIYLRDEYIQIKYGVGYSMQDVCLQPESYQQFKLISKNNMR